MTFYSLFFQKIIPAKTCYKTHNQELLPIIQAFKVWRHYLEGCKYEVFILMDYNNHCQFMDMKSLSFYHVHRPKSSFITTFKFIIVRKRQMKLLILHLDFRKGL